MREFGIVDEVQQNFPGGPIAMQPYQVRVIIEKRQLDTKREALGAFIEGDFYQTLPEEERDRLSQQAIVMTQYSDILGARIAAFPKPSF